MNVVGLLVGVGGVLAVDGKRLERVHGDKDVTDICLERNKILIKSKFTTRIDSDKARPLKIYLGA